MGLARLARGPMLGSWCPSGGEVPVLCARPHCVRGGAGFGSPPLTCVLSLKPLFFFLLVLSFCDFCDARRASCDLRHYTHITPWLRDTEQTTLWSGGGLLSV